MPQQRPRALAICAFRRRNRILVMEGYDAVKGETFYRPLGGSIEMGEHSSETIRRELREELGAEVGAVRYLGTLENVFTYQGQPGHEIVLVYDGAFTEQTLYEATDLVCREDNGESCRALWKDLADFGPGRCILYPAGLLELLQATGEEP